MKNNFWIVLFFVLLFSCNTNKKEAPKTMDEKIAQKKSYFKKPINPNATEEAVNLLDFLYKIKGEYILTGQHNYISSGSRFTEKVHEITGKYPVIWGSDFSFCAEGDNVGKYQHCGPLNLSDYGDSLEIRDITAPQARRKMIDEVKERYKKGHIITLMWHCCFPTEGNCCNGNSIWTFENRPDSSQWKELVTDSTTLNLAWKKQADEIANYLKELQEAKIPVLWRPYHEMNGVWFWWCNQKGEDGFARLWKMMYHYFTDHHKLNNLLWVWNTNAPRDIPGDEAFPYKDFFPGKAYVDILAADVYRKDYKQSHHDDLVELAGEKPIALGEVGELPEPEILDQQKQWTWFMPWAYLLFRDNSPEKINAVFNHKRALNLNNIERDENGKILIR